jgi:hypothetical protein
MSEKIIPIGDGDELPPVVRKLIADPNKWRVIYEERDGVLVLTEQRERGWRGMNDHHGADCIDGPLAGKCVLVAPIRGEGMVEVVEEGKPTSWHSKVVRVEGHDDGEYYGVTHPHPKSGIPMGMLRWRVTESTSLSGSTHLEEK